MANDLTTTRSLNATPDEVWAALTDAEIIKQWWGPSGFSSPKAAVNVQVGEASLVCMSGPGFPTVCNTWNYTEIVPGKRLVFDQRWANMDGEEVAPEDLGMPPGLPKIVPHTIELAEGENGTTLLTWSEYGYASPQMVEMSKAGLEQVLDKLALAVER